MYKQALLPAILIIVMCCHKSYGQLYEPAADALPVFKKISHPFMPTITSEYFYFSNDGLMWFSTARGLTSFDGSEVVYYSDNEQAYKLGLNKITAMLDDDSGNLYIGTSNGVIVFNRARQDFKSLTYIFPDDQRLADLQVNSFYKYNATTLYIGLNNKGMLDYNMHSGAFEQIDFTAFIPEDCTCKSKAIINSVLSFAENPNDPNSVWVGTYNGIFSYHTGTKKLSRLFNVLNPAVNKYNNFPVLYDIRTMAVANDSIIWFSTSVFGMGKYHIPSGEVTLFLHGARLKTPDLWKAYTLNSFARWKDDLLILGVASPHPGVFDIRTGDARLFSVTKDPESLDDIQFIANDRKGNVWLLDHAALFASLPDHYNVQSVNIEEQTTKNYLPNQLGDIDYDSKESVYYAAVVFSSGVHVLDKNFKPLKIIPTPLYTNRYTYRETSNEFITQDGSGRWWTTCLETYILEPGGRKFEYADKISPSLSWLNTVEEMLDLATTKDGNVLFKTLSGTVYHINHKTFATDTLFIPDYGTKADYVVTTKMIAYDSSRNTVYLNNDKYIVQYNLDKKTSRQVPVSQILSGTPHSIQDIEFSTDFNNRIWIWAPWFGIYIINPDSFVCEDSIANGTRGFISGNYDYLRYGGDGYMFLMGQKGTLIYNYKKERSLLLDHGNLWGGVQPYFVGYCNNHLVMNERNRIRYYNLDNFEKFDFTVNPVINTITSDTSVVYIRDRRRKETLTLSHQQNNLAFLFSAQEFFFPERIQYAYQLEGVDKDWQYTNALNRKINYTRLPPGKYTFKLKAQIEGGDWSVKEVTSSIEIVPAFWQTRSFRLLVIAAAIGLIIALVNWRITGIRKKEEQKTKYEKELLELEAKALRTQMNPHFVFNSLNSIKSIIDKNENEKAVNYLTTFSKLIRILFQNSGKREISLYEELETCRLYATLEKMRFGDKLNVIFDVDESLDLKDIEVPALILQPFIENAIWHGLMPKEEGGNVWIAVRKRENGVDCIIEDDGIGRSLSQQFKSAYNANHQSKGITLAQERLELDRLLNSREETIAITDRDGKSGTIVTLTFKENLL
ncbi:MAG: histidine kinase [Chitinophagaceae bacterium]|nr:histidine kinase [Chitinophagaceae bacterium]